MASQVIVFDYGEPCHRLLAWALADSGLHNLHVTALPDVVSLLDRQHTSVVVINSVESADELARITQELRNESSNLRIVVVHAGVHSPEQQEILTDLCIHAVADMEDMVAIITAALDNELPATEPHEAAREVIASDKSG